MTIELENKTVRIQLKRIDSEYRELQSLLESQYESINDAVVNKKRWNLAYHSVMYWGGTIVGEGDMDREGFIASECLQLYPLLEKISFPEASRIRRLCETICFKVLGYRVQDAKHAPDMVKFSCGKTVIQLLCEADNPKPEPQESADQKFVRELKEAFDKRPPNLSESLITGSIITLIVWIVCRSVYSYLCYADNDFYPTATEHFVFESMLVIGTLIGLLGLEGYFKGLSKLAQKARYYFYLYRWRIRWCLFSYPSKIKYYLVDKSGYVYLIMAILVLLGIFIGSVNISISFS
jgi:hypothetical protein